MEVGRQVRGGVGLLLALSSARTFRAASEALRPLGMTPRSYTVLEHLLDSPRSQRELAEMLDLDPSRIVALVDTLVAAGMVERLPDPADRRVRLITPTDHGRASAVVAREASERAVDGALAPLTSTERDTLVDLLARLTDRG
ncbi:MarR family winged helix-turn-helix transcriptional regulator [Georgenia sp. Z1491]|uniref:MarR family winged helix-turn-helix transcriptional regulator n=1 Tax=Georgenia sp. Z1491 TaxID=3416707 RepID=UPI003CE80B10